MAVKRVLLAAALSSAVLAAPATTTIAASATTAGSAASTTATYSGNPFNGVQQWANAYYASEISANALATLTGAMATKAAEVAKVPTFQWLDTAAKVPTVMVETLGDIRAANAAGASPPYAGLFVVYDLPDRDCAAAASNGEYSIADNGVANYKAYIDSIKTQLTTYSDVRSILVVEPDSLANMVTNLNVAKCANAQSAYYECVNYAIETLNLPNVAMYLDAGHAGWLGWSANLQPAATLFAQVYKNASSPAAVRGLATNVANYNAWNLSSAPSYTQGDSNYDESLYVQALEPLLSSAGFNAYFITDQSRSGKQPTGQSQWGDWCNAIGTGFGTRPTTSTGLSVEDAFVWVKPGGECDGTSNTSSPRYDYHCGYSDALQPAPEAGTWFEAYFEQLLTNANPAF
ncbi:family 6 glycoside hydrolase [Cryphonectria parasitica EP155]|uniref:Glucanase n=1 Tax=Cryphonectria parasitica (strain ATCC 38755 / EP155) TaxID=660469 RepID=A0A9P5CJP3_CRYP1|nr:family 6 glycoside hydrolase [Cryphonectria parasitica EP155]KAF3760337.1 family 6 glycoside hydrolase [Cryphonectria parasitica EP155]